MSGLNQSIGPVRAAAPRPHGVRLDTDEAVVELTAYSDSIIRVHVTHGGAPSPPSYAVVAEPSGTEVDLEIGRRRIVLRTGKLRVRVGRQPLRLQFCTPLGATINADDPAFGTSWIGTQVTTYKSLQKGERFVGLGEKTGDLDRSGSAYTNWNTDYFGYPADGDPLYASIPFYTGIHSGLVYGIFLDNTHRSQFNFGASNDRFAYFSADDGEMDYYFMHGESVRDIIADYTWLTGRMPLPPRWSLGYHQCRYSYYPDSEVRALAHGFRDRDIPADVIHLDIHHMDGYKVFTWDPDRFPRPRAMVNALGKLGFRAVAILDPGIVTEKGYRYYEEGMAQDLFVRYPDGQPYRAQVWPGWCHFPDFTDPRVRSWWGRSLRAYLDVGVKGLWNDMNEPASWGQQTPDLIEFDFDGHRTTHRQARNIYGLQMARSSYEGARAGLKGQRPFILTRAAFSGIQRYAALWTGDNVSSDEHMIAGVRLLNSLGLSGVAFAGFDIGGFAGEASPELFARWISIGALSPFCRGHTMINSRASEPWAYGEEVEAIARNYLKLRYRLLPYIYSTFHESTCTGLPVARSLVIDFPHDPHIYEPAYQNQYLFGHALLVAPVPSNVEVAHVYLPPGIWYDLYTDERHRGGRAILVDAPVERLPVFVRAGAIVPMQQAVTCTDEEPTGPLELHVYGGAAGSLVYYEDDGVSYDYEDGAFLRRQIRLEKNSLELDRCSGRYTSKFRRLRVLLHGQAPGAAGRVSVDGKPQRVSGARVRFCAPLASFDPLYQEDRDPYGEIELGKLDLPNRKGPISISWK